MKRTKYGKGGVLEDILNVGKKVAQTLPATNMVLKASESLASAIKPKTISTPKSTTLSGISGNTNLESTTNLDPDYWYNMIYGTSLPDYSSGISNIANLYNQRDVTTAPYQQEMLSLARSIAQQKGNESQVVDLLTRKLAEKYGGYKTALTQSATAQQQALDARTQAIADLANRFRTTEGDIAPQVLAAATTAAQPKQVAAQVIADALQTQIGNVQNQVQQGLQAYRDTYAGNQALMEALANQYNLETGKTADRATLEQLAMQMQQQQLENKLGLATTGLDIAQTLGSQASTLATGILNPIIKNNVLNAVNYVNGLETIPYTIDNTKLTALVNSKNPLVINNALIAKAQTGLTNLTDTEKAQLYTLGQSLGFLKEFTPVDAQNYATKLSPELGANALNDFSVYMSQAGKLATTQTTQQKVSEYARNYAEMASLTNIIDSMSNTNTYKNPGKYSFPSFNNGEVQFTATVERPTSGPVKYSGSLVISPEVQSAYGISSIGKINNQADYQKAIGILTNYKNALSGINQLLTKSLTENV